MKIRGIIPVGITILLFLANASCDTTHTLKGGTDSTVRVINPIIEFCERLYPVTLYPDTTAREPGITDCMQLCQDSGDCAVDVNSLPPGTFDGVGI